MIKLVVGLGNPGQQYEKTRHNAGFLFLDSLANDRGVAWSSKPEFQSLMASFNLSSEKVLLLKPQTYMNRSGLAVGKVLRYFKLEPEEVLVVHDELDFDPGLVRLKKDGGHAGHNGLRDIISHLGAKNFYRIRIGIGRPKTSAAVADFVLTVPGKIDAQLINAAIEQGIYHIDQIVGGDIMAAMNKLNASK